MKKVLFLVALFSFLVITPSFAEITVPEKVKIGLYYGTSAVPLINLKGQQGTTVGFNKGGSFNTIYDDTSNHEISIRKDSYFVKNGSLVLEFKPTDKSIPQGNQFGPYHIQIGSSYPDKDSADKKVQELQTKSLNSFPVYCNGSWYVWYGLFLDANSAQQAIDSTLNTVIGNGIYNVMQPSGQRVQVIDGDNVVMMFEDKDSYLGVRSKHTDDQPELININGKNFRGEVEIRRYIGSDMTIINILPLEEYLYGVVPREIGGNSPIEAVKAQAVAARNYSIQSIGKNSKWGFDMTNTVSDQAYGGYEWEVANSNRGVDETKGKKLVYNGKLASVFYFSTSGGITEDVKNVWGSEGYPYLVSVEDKYEPQNLPKSEWEVTLTPAQIKSSLKTQGYDLGDIQTVQPMEFTPSGRVVKLLIRGTTGEKVFEREKCRTVLGKDILSQLYTVSTNASVSAISLDGKIVSISLGDAKVKSAAGVYAVSQGGSQITANGAGGKQQYSNASSGGFRFIGRGWGHGIGMSQNGAIGMAKANFTYDQILQWYFKGTCIE
jgi:stage II sporulation protein D